MTGSQEDRDRSHSLNGAVHLRDLLWHGLQNRTDLQKANEHPVIEIYYEYPVIGIYYDGSYAANKLKRGRFWRPLDSLISHSYATQNASALHLSNSSVKNLKGCSYWLGLAQVSASKLYIKSLRKVSKIEISHVPHFQGSDSFGLGHGSRICIIIILPVYPVVPMRRSRAINCVTMMYDWQRSSEWPGWNGETGSSPNRGCSSCWF